MYTDDMGLFIPGRPAGTITVHKKELHAVSRLLTGVRYSLFVVDETSNESFLKNIFWILMGFTSELDDTIFDTCDEVL